MKTIYPISIFMLSATLSCCNNSSKNKTTTDTTFSTPMDNTRTQDTGIRNLDTSSYDRMHQKMNDSTQH